MHFAWLRRMLKRKKSFRSNKAKRKAECDKSEVKGKWSELLKGVMHLQKGRHAEKLGKDSSTSSSSEINKGMITNNYKT